jgi:hypothetical protein
MTYVERATPASDLRLLLAEAGAMIRGRDVEVHRRSTR